VKTNPVIVLLGPPASGKGTQADRIAGHTGAVIIATGELLRRAIEDNSSLGKLAGGKMAAGELVPDTVIIALVRTRIAEAPPNAPILLDGFPRTLLQAVALDEILPPRTVLFIDLEEEEIIRRISGRRIGPNGEPYHLVFNPPPAGVPVTQRNDDREEVVRERLYVYRTRTEPLLSYYETRGILHRISGLGTMDDVFARILPQL